MKIQFYGKCCFDIKTKDNTVVFNPIAEFQEQASDIACFSGCPKETKKTYPNVKKALTLPGEYEISGLLIKGMFADNKDNIIFKVVFDSMTFLHLGEKPEIPTKELVKNFGENVEVLFLCVHEDFNGKQVKETIEKIDPRIVFIGGDTEFFPQLLELGAKHHEEETFNMSKSVLNEEKTDIIILGTN